MAGIENMTEGAEAVQPAIDESPEAVVDEIERTRSQLGEKIATLDQALRNTADEVSSEVKQEVHKVKQNLDIRYQIAQRPFFSIGAAFAAGAVLPFLVNRQPQYRPGSLQPEQGNLATLATSASLIASLLSAAKSFR